MVEHKPQHLKVMGLSPAVCNGREKDGNRWSSFADLGIPVLILDLILKIKFCEIFLLDLQVLIEINFHCFQGPVL